jgi:hypothetical protein
VEAVELARDGVLAAIDGLTDQQAQFRPGEGEWCIAEIVEHLCLSEMSGVAKIWAAADALRGGARWAGESPHRGKHIEEIVAETWRPKEQAQSITTPHIGGPIHFWRASLRSLAPVLAGLVAALDGLRLEHVVSLHFRSGPLDGRQRLEFLRFHIERHLLQIRRVETSAAFPRSVGQG